MVQPPPSPAGVVRFGVFELDLRAGELRKAGARITLQDQPLEILKALLERPGDLVTRDELRQRLWPADTFVDFEHGLNAAVKRLRDALGDSAETPRFVETLPRRGYRFVGAVNGGPHIDAPDALAAPPHARGDVAAAASVGAATRSRMRRHTPRVLLAAAVFVAVWSVWTWRSHLRAGGDAVRTSNSAPMLHMVLELPAEAPLSLGRALPRVGFDSRVIALSRDGSHLAYVGHSAEHTQLFVRALDRALDTAQVRPIPGTEGAVHPFFSPDGKWLGFLTDDAVKKVALGGGTPAPLAQTFLPYAAEWMDDGWIYLLDRQGQRLTRVAVAGGRTEMIRPKENPAVGRLLQVLPEAKWALATDKTGGISSDYRKVGIFSLENGKATMLLQGGFGPMFAPPNALLFARGGNLLAVRFDRHALRVAGEPVLLAADVAMDSLFGQLQAAASDNGLLAYVPGGDRAIGRLAWVDRSGATEFLDMPAQVYGFFQLSPDGSRIAIHVADATDYIWLYDVRQRRGTQLRGSQHSGWPVWSPDGRRLAFSSWVTGDAPWTVGIRSADDTAPERQILSAPGMVFPSTWSADDALIAIDQVYPMLRFGFLKTKEPGEPIWPASNTGWSSTFSPDGKWIAYMSYDSGRSEVYVRAYPDGPPVRISIDGGLEPLWCRCGSVFYRVGDQWMSVKIRTDPVLTWDPPLPAFTTDFIDTPGRSYDISPDGRRLLVLKQAEPRPARKIHLLSNWMKRLE